MRLSDQKREHRDGDDGSSIITRSTKLSIMKWAFVVPATAGLIVISSMALRGTTTTSSLPPASAATAATKRSAIRRTTTSTGATSGNRDLQGVMSCATDANCPNLYCPEKPCTAFLCREGKCSVTTLTAETAAPLTTSTPSPTSAPVVANNNTVNNTTNVTMMPKPSPFPTPASPTPLPTSPPTMNSTTTTTTEQQLEDQSEEYMFVGNDVCTKAVGPIPITAQGLGDTRAILVHGTTDSSSASLSASRQQQQQPQQQSYAPVCNKISHNGPGAWYTVTGTGARMTASTCWPGSSYDTALSVYTNGNRRKRTRRLKKEDNKDKDKDKEDEDEDNDEEDDENNNPGEDGAAGEGGTGVCGSLQCVNANDDASGNFGSCQIKSTLSRVQWESVRGQTYYILVHGFFQRVGNFDLNVISARPMNERCVDATSIPINGPNIIGTTFQAQLPWGPDKATNCGGRFGLVGDTSSVWYRVRSDRTQTLEASTCNPLTDFDTKLHIFQGSCSNSGSCLGGNDNHNSPNRCSLTTWTAQAGTDYYILVHAFMFDNGLFDLTVRSL